MCAWFATVSRGVVAGIMAFGAGVLISALAFDLVDEAERSGGLAALLGNLLLHDASPATIAVITAVAAGAILTMIADTMIPEAFERSGVYTGLIATIGFLTAFTVERLGG